GVTYIADNMTHTGATTATGAIATLRQNTNGQLINLGGADAAGTLGLTNAELSTITAGTLRIGNVSAGNMTISADIAPAGTSTLSLQTGGTMTQTAGILTVTNLAIRSGGQAMLFDLNAVGTLAG